MGCLQGRLISNLGFTVENEEEADSLQGWFLGMEKGVGRQVWVSRSASKGIGYTDRTLRRLWLPGCE